MTATLTQRIGHIDHGARIHLAAALPGGPTVVFVHDTTGTDCKALAYLTDTTRDADEYARGFDPTRDHLLVTSTLDCAGTADDPQVHAPDPDTAGYASTVLTQIAEQLQDSGRRPNSSWVPGVEDTLPVFAEALARRADGQAWVIAVIDDPHNRVLAQFLTEELAEAAETDGEFDPLEQLTDDELSDAPLSIKLGPAHPGVPFHGARWLTTDNDH